MIGTNVFISIVATCAALCTVISPVLAQFEGEALKFKLSAVNLPQSDFDGPSDPYVKLFHSTQRPQERHHNWHLFGQTSVKVNTLNPVWDEVFTYQFINGTNQRWRFIVKDQDDSWLNPFDYHLGRVELSVDDYVIQLRKAKQNQTELSPLKAIQMFLTQPIGGALLVNPITD